MELDANEFEQGFLSELPFDAIRDDIRRRYADLRALLLQTNAQCVAAQHAISFDSNDSRSILAASLYARTLASTQATVILLERGMRTQARAILRVAIETLILLGAVYRKPETAGLIIESHEADRRTVADRMLRWKSPELRASVTAQISDAELEVFKSSKAPKVNVFDMAKAADMEDWYLAPYSLLSFTVHAAVSDLQNHIVLGRDGLIESLQNEPEAEDQSGTWALAIEVQLKAAQALAGIFGEVPVNHVALRDELIVLAGLQGN